MIPSILLGLALVAPADTPIEPIDEDTVTIGLTLADEDLCDQAASLDGLLIEMTPLLGVEGVEVLRDMARVYVQNSFEEGFGPSAALTVEAEAYFQEWLEGCGL